MKVGLAGHRLECVAFSRAVPHLYCASVSPLKKRNGRCLDESGVVTVARDACFSGARLAFPVFGMESAELER